MKRMTAVRLFTASVIFAAGAVAPNAQAQPTSLGQEMFIRIDANRDSKVSMAEYVDYGTDYLRKKGRRADRVQLQKKFDGFDRNRDGFITDEDPAYRSPKELLDEKIAGTWAAESGSKTMSFVFMPDNQADVIQNGESMREKARGKMKYRFVHPSRTPTCLDIIVDRGADSDYYIKCILEFTSEDQMKLRMIAGSDIVVRPRDFPEGGGTDTIVLNRIECPEPTPLVASREVRAEPVNSEREDNGVHRGTITAKVRIEKDSGRSIEHEKKQKPAGLMVTTTTKRTRQEIQALTISVFNTGPERDTFELCWYFFCRPRDGRAVRVYDEGSTQITLDPRKRATHSVASKKTCLVEQTVQQENSDTGCCRNPVDSVRGDQAEGFLVLLKHGNVILDKKSNEKEFLSDQWLSKL